MTRRVFSSEKTKAENSATTTAPLQNEDDIDIGRNLLGLLLAAATASGFMMVRPESMSNFDRYNGVPTLLGLTAFATVAPAASIYGYPAVWIVLLGVESFTSTFEAVMRASGTRKLTSEEESFLETEISHIVTDRRIFEAWKTNTADCMLLDTLATSIWLKLADNSIATQTANVKIPRAIVEENVKKLILQDETLQGEKEKQVATEAMFHLLSVADIQDRGNLSFADFYRALTLMLMAQHDEAARHELFFHTIDLDNHGFINKKELLVFVRRLVAVGGVPKEDRFITNRAGMSRPAKPLEITKKWMKRFDIDEDGIISRDEFYRMACRVDFEPTLIFTDCIEIFEKR